MKRLTALTVALLIGVTMFAQQALWGTAPVVSPEIHDNNTVTFRFKAPKAVRVQLTGDFLPVQKNAKFEAPGIVDLKEGQEGVWEYTTPEPHDAAQAFHVRLRVAAVAVARLAAGGNEPLLLVKADILFGHAHNGFHFVDLHGSGASLRAYVTPSRKGKVNRF